MSCVQAAIYLCGHEHVMQYKRCAGAVAQCVLGAVAHTGFYGGIGKSADEMDWWDESYSRGFLAVTIGADEASLQFVCAESGQVGVHHHGACAPTTTRATRASPHTAKSSGHRALELKCLVMCMRF